MSDPKSFAQPGGPPPYDQSAYANYPPPTAGPQPPYPDSQQPYPGPPPPTTVHFGQPPPTAVHFQTQTFTVTNVPTTCYTRHSTTVQCPHCQACVTTQVCFEPGAMAWIIFFACFVAGFFLFIPWFLCWIPFCIDDCKNVVHTCPNCHRQLAVVEAGSRH